MVTSRLGVKMMILGNSTTRENILMPEDSSSQHGVAKEYIELKEETMLLSAIRSKIPCACDGSVKPSRQLLTNGGKETYMCQRPWEKEVPSL